MGLTLEKCPCRYDFTDGDLQVSLTQMKMFLNEYEQVSNFKPGLQPGRAELLLPCRPVENQTWP